MQTRDSFCPAACSFTGEHQTSFCPSTNHRRTHTAEPRSHPPATRLESRLRPRALCSPPERGLHFFAVPFLRTLVRRSIALFFGISAVTQPRAAAGAAPRRTLEPNQTRAKCTAHTLTHSPGLGMSAPYRLERSHADEKIAERIVKSAKERRTSEKSAGKRSKQQQRSVTVYLRILLVRPMDRRLIFYTLFDVHVMRSHTGSTAPPLHSIGAQTSPANHREQMRNNRRSQKTGARERADARSRGKIGRNGRDCLLAQKQSKTEINVQTKSNFCRRRRPAEKTLRRSIGFQLFTPAEEPGERRQNRQIKNYNTCRE